ncbi:MAG: flagellar export protein FliJ [Thermodesulfobacteriota bacterium]
MPKPFRFSLQKVLEYRGQLEDQAKIALAKAQHAHREQTRAVESLDKALAAHLETMASAGEQTAAGIWLSRNYAKRLTGDLYLARQAEARLARDVQERRAELAERAKERKLLEKLKETQSIRHEREESRKEQSGFDEMATLRYQAPAL